MPGQAPSYVANADIGVSLFVNLVGEHRIETAVAGVQAVGVSHEGPQEALLPPHATDATPQIAARAGTSTRIYGVGETCEVIAAAAIPAGSFVGPDANGQAVVIAAASAYSARARNATSATGEKLQITIEHGVA